MSPRLPGLLAALLLATFATHAVARPLVRPDGRRIHGMASEVLLTVDRAAVAELRGRQSAVVESFPLGTDGMVTLDLVRIEPFAPTTRVEEMTDTGVHTVPLPDQTYFGGHVRGDAGSRVLLIAANDGVRGFVVHDGMTYPFGADETGTHRSYAFRDVDPAAFPPPSDFCSNDLHPEMPGLAAPMPRAPTPDAFVTAKSSTVLEVEAAIETDNELRSKFGSTAATLNYLTALLAAANVIYGNDVNVKLTFTYVRIWSSTDPWTATGIDNQLTQLKSYWSGHPVAAPHDIVHWVSGRPVEGGIAYVGTVCNPAYAFGVSQVNGSFNVSNPNSIWDVLVFTHEVGHNLGSVHTHCYNPPLDHCFNQEAGCYSGPVSLPPGGGTIMSYCHLVNDSLADVNLVFGPTVSSTIRGTVEGASCLSAATSCGDGALDPGEQCDDGNNVSGDGCSASCVIECGNGTIDGEEQCDDGNTTGGDGCSATCTLETTCGDGVVQGVEQCDDGNTTSGDGCSSICRLELACGNGVQEGSEQCDDGNKTSGDGCSAVCRLEFCGNRTVDVGEDCDDGNTTAGDGCSPTCEREPRCGDGTLDANEECDDGNTKSDDGCSATCTLEPCQVIVPHQTAWSPAKLVATPGRLLLHVRFGISASVADLQALVDEGLELMVDGASGAEAMDVIVPGGTGWTLSATRARYRDPAGSADGVRSIVVRVRGEGIATVDLKFSSHGGAAPNLDDAPPVVTVLLGDETAGEIGACGHHVYGGDTCVRRGKKLVCR